MCYFLFLSSIFHKKSFTVFLAILFSFVTVFSQTVIKEKIIIRPNFISKSMATDTIQWNILCADLCNGNKDSPLYYDISSVNFPGFPLHMEINCSPDIQFVDFWRDSVMGKTTVIDEASLKYSDRYGIRLNTLYYGISPEAVTLTVIRNGEEKIFGINVLPENFNIYSERNIYQNGYVLLKGSSVNSEVIISPGYCSISEFPPDMLKYNLEIIKGSYLGNIEITGVDSKEKIINNVPLEEGKLKFIFVADGDLLNEQDTAIVRCTTSFPNVDPAEINIAFTVLKNQPIEVTFSRSTIAPGDTVDVFLKKRNSDGSLSPFCPDQLFDISIIDGADYGTFFLPQWSDTTDQASFVTQGFKFVAANTTSNSSFHSTIQIKTSGQIPCLVSPITPGQNEKSKLLRKLVLPQNVLPQKNTLHITSSIKSDLQQKDVLVNKSFAKATDGDCVFWDSGLQLFGTATIAINSGTHIKAYFEKEKLLPGDTVNIIVKNVDKDGNETNYSAETNFEVAIVKGCGLGLINGTDSHVTNIRQPIKFVVANPITGTDSTVVLRVGTSIVNSTPPAGLVAKAFSLSKSKTTSKIVLNNSNRLLAKVSDEASCTIYTPIYTNTADAEAGIDKAKIKITLTGEKDIWPYLPPTPKGASRGADRPGYNPLTSLKIKVINGNTSLSNTRVKVTITRLEGTGGHDHTNTLEVIKCGKINGYDNPHVFTTDRNGEILIQQLRSSEVSGRYKIKAALESDGKINDTTSIVARVPCLVDFRSILYDGWELTGNHAYNDAHLYNHFCDQEMGIALADIIIDFNEWNNDYCLSINEQPQKIHINDMSLIGGGDFDFPALWNLEKEHKFHRVGFSVDVDRTLDRIQLKKLSELVMSNKILSGIRDRERPMIHYEFQGGYWK